MFNLETQFQTIQSFFTEKQRTGLTKRDEIHVYSTWFMEKNDFENVNNFSILRKR